MDSRILTPTERSPAVVVVLAAVLVLLASTGAVAHDAPRTAIRELVRLQGHVLEEGTPPEGEVITVSVNGKALAFRVDERQVFIAVGAAATSTTAPPTEVVVRGQRELLARLANATPEQRVTLLGERRPGASEIFLAAVDVCGAAGVP